MKLEVTYKNHTVWHGGGGVGRQENSRVASCVRHLAARAAQPLEPLAWLAHVQTEHVLFLRITATSRSPARRARQQALCRHVRPYIPQNRPVHINAPAAPVDYPTPMHTNHSPIVW